MDFIFKCVCIYIVPFICQFPFHAKGVTYQILYISFCAVSDFLYARLVMLVRSTLESNSSFVTVVWFWVVYLVCLWSYGLTGAFWWWWWWGWLWDASSCKVVAEDKWRNCACFIGFCFCLIWPWEFHVLRFLHFPDTGVLHYYSCQILDLCCNLFCNLCT